MKTFFQKVRSNEAIVLLSHPPYFNFTLSVIFSQLGFYTMNVVFIFLVFALTKSNFSVSILLVTFLLPQMVLSFFGGILADLRNKKNILIYGNILRGIVLLLLFFNTHSILLVYFVSFVVSIATQFYTPAEAPMIPSLIREKSQLIIANSLFGLGLFGIILIGYVFAGPAIDTFGMSNVFLVLSTFFFLAAFFAWLIPDSGKSEMSRQAALMKMQSALRSELRESYFILRKTSDIGGAFFLLAFSQVIILVLATVVPGYAEKVLGVTPEKLSLLLFAPVAIGMGVAAIFINSLGRKLSRTKLMTTGVLLSGLSLILFPFISHAQIQGLVQGINTVLPARFPITTVQLSIVLALIAGFANACIFIPSQTIIQDITPENYQSKIYGLLYAFIGVLSLIPIILAGSLADVIGVQSVLIGIGVFILCIGFIRIRRRMYKTK